MAAEVEQIYRQIAGTMAFGDLAFGGDSHAREVADRAIGPVRDLYENGNNIFAVLEERFVDSGMTCERFLDHRKYRRLLQSRANMVVLLLGGNDLDSLTVKHQQVLNLQRVMFNQLTAEHKIVYICENPTRFSKRTVGLDFDIYKAERQKLAREQLRMFGGRFIPLPSYCFNQANFVAQKHRRYGMEYVHLNSLCYTKIAQACVDHIKADLAGRKSPPSDPKLQLLTYND